MERTKNFWYNVFSNMPDKNLKCCTIYSVYSLIHATQICKHRVRSVRGFTGHLRRVHGELSRKHQDAGKKDMFKSSKAGSIQKAAQSTVLLIVKETL